MEKEDQQKKHACKFCSRSFSNGRILGGHMKTHKVKRPAHEEFKLETNSMGFEAYGLRENPKKSWKFSGLNQNDGKPVQENVKCRLCGKEFDSKRALHGHLRHHSGKERRGVRCKKCGKLFKAARSLAAHVRMHSNESGSISRPNLAELRTSDSTQTLNLVRKRRSKRTRYGATANSSLSGLNESISGTDIEEEAIEVAICLMMLSRGVCKWGGFNSVRQSLYDTSVSFESQPLDQNKRTRNEGGDAAFDREEFVEMKKSRKENSDLHNSDSPKSNWCEFSGEMASDVEKKVEHEASVEKIFNGIDLNGSEMDDESGFVLFDAKIVEVIHGEKNSGTNEAETTQNVAAEDGLGLASMGFVKPGLSKKVSCNTGVAELEKDSCHKITFCGSDSKSKAHSLKKSRFQCRFCNKMFPSYQALGGHQTLHRTIKSCHKLKSKNDEKDIQATLSPEVEATSMIVEPESVEDSKVQEKDVVTVACHESGEDKEHKCQIKILSGQALGGHRRAHIANARQQQTVAMEEEADICSENFSFRDAEGHWDVGFNSCWDGASGEHVPLVGLLAN